MLMETLLNDNPASTKEPFKIDPLAGKGASILSAIDILKSMKYRLDYLHDKLDEIPPDHLRYYKHRTRPELEHSITQSLVFGVNCLTDQLNSRQPARNHQDAIERLSDHFDSLYGSVDDIVFNGLTLGSINLLLVEMDRYCEDLRAIQAGLEAQEATTDMFDEGCNHA